MSALVITRTVAEARAWVEGERAAGRTVGFVPTMGALHAGHVSLIEASVRDNDRTVVSIFVNPTQFGPLEDLSKYPRPFEKDAALCQKAGAHMIYAPSPEVMYPKGYATYVNVERLTETLCGAKRPGHFRGVATVVTKLFNVVRAHRAYFGQKDAQQVRVIEQMVRDLDIDVEVVRCPIVREKDGLAMSSRNAYLTPSQRQTATVLTRALAAVEQAHAQGESRVPRLKELALALINREPHAYVDYVEFVAADTLLPLERVEGRTLVALAVRVGAARLIDNVLIAAMKPARRAGGPSRPKGPSGRTSRPSPKAPPGRDRATRPRK